MDLDSNIQVTFMFLTDTYSAPYSIEIGIIVTRSNTPYSLSHNNLFDYLSTSGIIFKDTK